MKEEESKELARLVARHLLQLRGDALPTYLKSFYQLDFMEGLSTDLVFAVEVERGNFSNGELSSVSLRWWQVSNDDCLSIPFLDMKPFNAASDAGKLWPYPVVAYFAELPLLLSREGIGTVSSQGIERILKYYRVCSVEKKAGSLSITEELKSWPFRR